MKEKVIEYLKSVNEPKSLEEIERDLNQYATGTVISNIRRAVIQLKEEGKIVESTASNGRKYYFINDNGVTYNDLIKLKTKTMEMLVPAKSATDETTEELERLQKEIKGIYANMISIMAVFVAIFSIVFAGGSYLFQIAQGAWTWRALRAFFATEGAIVLAILIMLWGIKRFLFK